MSSPIRRSRIHWVAPALGALVSGVITPAQAADGYWLDQYNALLYLASFQLDRELEQTQRQGAGVVMVHADSLPGPLLRWIAWRARRAQLQPVAWIQRPTAANLRRVGAVSGYQADHSSRYREPLAQSISTFLRPRITDGPIAQLSHDQSKGFGGLRLRREGKFYDLYLSEMT